MGSAVLFYVLSHSQGAWTGGGKAQIVTIDPTAGARAMGPSFCRFPSLKLVSSPSCPSQVPGCGDLNKCRLKRKNSSSGVPPLVMATDKILTLSLEQEQPEGLLSPLASPLHPLEVQGLICGPRFPSLPERLGPVPKQLEFQRHGSDPGLARS